jgi:putative tricarboxylic transport membrane protein
MRSPADLLTGIVMLGLSGAIFYVTRGYPHGTIEQGMGPAFLPNLLAVSLAILSVLLILKTLIHGKDRKDDAEGSKPFAERLKEIRNPAAICLLVFIYIELLDNLGYVISTALFLLAVLKLFRASWPMALAIGLGLTALVFFVFDVGLHVPLPPGSFWQV